MDVPEALNTVVRFTTYASIVLSLATSKTQYLVAIPVVLAVTAIFGAIFPTTADLVETFGGSVVKSLSGNVMMPTAENPFMNVLLTQIKDDPHRPDAASLRDPEVKRAVKESFQHTTDLYMDTSDRFDQAQAMRTFHTLQSSMVGGDLDGFKSFLAKGNDDPDFSSAPPSRHAKSDSETYVIAKGSLASLPNTTDRPTGTSPSGATTKA